MRSIILNDFEMMAEGTEKVIYQFLDMKQKRVQDFSSDGFVSDQLKKIVNGNKAAVKPLNEHLIKNKLPLDKTIHSISLISLNGIVVASSDKSLIGKDVSRETFFNNFKNGKMVTDNISGFEDIPTISILSPMTDRDTGAALGAIASFISLDELGSLLSGEFFKEKGAVTVNNSMLRTMEVYVVNADRLMITKSLFTKDSVLKQKVETLPVAACLESNREMTGLYNDYRGIGVLGSSMCISYLKWTILVEVDKSEIEAPLLRMRNGAITLFIAISGFIGVLFIMFQKAAVVPINRVSRVSKEIALGNFNIALPVLSGDEIGVLSESTNNMARELENMTLMLKRSESSLTEAQRIAHIGNWSWNIGTNELVWSAEIYRIFGLRPQEFRATYETFVNCIHPDDRDLVARSINDTLRNKKPYSIDHRILLPDGSQRIVHEQAETIFDGSGRPAQMIGTVQDITERKRAEEEVRKLNEELEQRVMQRTTELTAANKELEAFSYSVSHDLRAPLRHIVGYSNLVQKNASAQLDETSKRYITVIADAAIKMGNLIDDLLAFSRAGRSDMQQKTVDLNQLVAETVGDIKRDAGARDISWKIAELPDVYGDTSMLKLVFVNLISNAVKFTGKKERAEIEINWKLGDNNETVVFIKDNGAGFDMKYVEKLFGVFQRLHKQEDFDGTGIGLANVRRIISRHGGRTWAEGAVNGGATFYFSLPTFRRV